MRPQRPLSPSTLLGLATLLLGSLACLPIPIPGDALDTPQITFTLQDEEGAPIQGASVMLHRTVRYPHFKGEAESSAQASSDAGGRASFAHSVYRRTQMPLMMHGVSTDVWVVCATHPSYARRFFILLVEGEQLVSVEDAGVVASWPELFEGRASPAATLTMLPRSGLSAKEDGACPDDLSSSRAIGNEPETGFGLRSEYAPRE